MCGHCCPLSWHTEAWQDWYTACLPVASVEEIQGVQRKKTVYTLVQMSKHYRLGAGPLLCCRPAQPSASLMFPVGLLFPPTKHSSRVPHLNKQHLCPPSGSCQEPSWEQFLTPSLTSSEPVTKSCRQSCQFYLRNDSSVHSTVSPRPTALSRSPLLRSHIYGHLYSSRKSVASLAFPPPTHILAPFIPSSSTNVRSDHPSLYSNLRKSETLSQKKRMIM
ncbi:uncharacterized protein LOC144338321 [Macaca mulatta]